MLRMEMRDEDTSGGQDIEKLYSISTPRKVTCHGASLQAIKNRRVAIFRTHEPLRTCVCSWRTLTWAYLHIVTSRFAQRADHVTGAREGVACWLRHLLNFAEVPDTNYTRTHQLHPKSFGQYKKKKKMKWASAGFFALAHSWHGNRDYYITCRAR